LARAKVPLVGPNAPIQKVAHAEAPTTPRKANFIMKDFEVCDFCVFAVKFFVTLTIIVWPRRIFGFA
jgi:hypothetical protein